MAVGTTQAGSDEKSTSKGLADHAAESHKCHSKETCGNECDGRSLHSLRHLVHRELFADTGKEYQRQCEAQCSSEGKECPCEQVVVCAYGEFVGTVSHENSNSQQTAVGGNKWQEDSECLVERGRDFFEDNLYHLYECCNDQDKENGLQELDVPKDEQFLQEVGYNRSQGKHESNSSPHTHSGIDFLTYAQERTYTEELTEDDIVDEYRRDKYQNVNHSA